MVREPPPDPCDLVPRGVERLRARAREVDLQNERRAPRAAPQGREDAPAPEPRDDDGVAQVLGQPALRRVRRRRGRRARRGVAHVSSARAVLLGTVVRTSLHCPRGVGKHRPPGEPEQKRGQNALARAPISAATAPLPPQTGLNGSHAGTDSIEPIWGGRGAAGKKLFWQPLCCPKRFFAAAARPLRFKISEMTDVVAGKARAKSRRLWWRFHQKQRLGEKRGHRIHRHPLGLKWRSRLSVVDDHADDDIRHCGGPIGAKRRQKRRSHGFLLVFGSFLGERQPNCCRVFSSLFPGYYGLSLSVG